jgi:hypothetical protein
MASNFDRRLDRLEGHAASRAGDFNLTLVYSADSDERPVDHIEYQGQKITRRDRESLPDLERRALSAWGLSW